MQDLMIKERTAYIICTLSINLFYRENMMPATQHVDVHFSDVVWPLSLLLTQRL